MVIVVPEALLSNLLMGCRSGISMDQIYWLIEIYFIKALAA